MTYSLPYNSIRLHFLTAKIKIQVSNKTVDILLLASGLLMVDLLSSPKNGDNMSLRRIENFNILHDAITKKTVLLQFRLPAAQLIFA
jgi:hypothetical protein